MCIRDRSKCTGKAPEPPAETPEPEKEKPAGLNPAALVLLLALLGGGGVFAYLKLVKNKPKTKGNDSLDDYDYGEEDSEEWETEDEESGEMCIRDRLFLILSHYHLPMFRQDRQIIISPLGILGIIAVCIRKTGQMRGNARYRFRGKLYCITCKINIIYGNEKMWH